MPQQLSISSVELHGGGGEKEVEIIGWINERQPGILLGYNPVVLVGLYRRWYFKYSGVVTADGTRSLVERGLAMKPGRIIGGEIVDNTD